MHKFVFFYIAILFQLINYAQSTNKGATLSKSNTSSYSYIPLLQSKNTWAIIIGISDYDAYDDLNYADDDANALYKFLISKSGGSVPKSNIKLLLNSEANTDAIADIFTNYKKMINNQIKSGDLLFLYFSGHGACDETDSYLLLSNTPESADPISFENNSWALSFYRIKNLTKKFIQNGIDVVFISDACRDTTSEYNNRLVKSIAENNNGEIQMMSCSNGQQSVEGLKWGNGRGVFSYYLLDALYGNADLDPKDGNLTFFELFDYVKRNVRLQTNKSQTPFFCCSDFEDKVFTEIDTSNRNNYNTANANTNLSVTQNIGDADFITAMAIRKKGTLTDLKLDSNTYNNYMLFKKLLSNERIYFKNDDKKTINNITIKGSLTATVIFNTIKKNKKYPDLINKMESELQASITSYIQAKINNKLNNIGDKISYPLCASMLNYLISITDTNFIFYNSIKAQSILFTALSKDTVNLASTLIELKKCEVLYPKYTLLLYEIANINSLLKNYTIAEEYYLKTLKYSPRFALAYNNLAMNYLLNKQYDKSYTTILNAIKYNKNNKLIQQNYLDISIEYKKNIKTKIDLDEY